MRKADLKAGGIYANSENTALLLLSTDVIATMVRRNEPTTMKVAQGARLKRHNGWTTTYTTYSYLTVSAAWGREGANRLKELDHEKILADLLAGVPVPDALPKDCTLVKVYSLNTFVGPYEEVIAQAAFERDAQQRRDAEKTQQYNASIALINDLLSTTPVEHFTPKPDDWTWGPEVPSVTLSPVQVAAIAANVAETIERTDEAAFERGAGAVTQAMSDQIAMGDLAITTSAYDGE